MTFRLAVLGLAATAACFGASAGVAAAAPYCYETGPGYQKCVDGSSGGYFNPAYQGPKIFDSGIAPWVPTYNPPILPPVFVAPPPPPVVTNTMPIDQLSQAIQADMQAFFDNPANGQAQAALRFGRVALTRTGDTTYEGVVAASALGGPVKDVPVHVTSDGSNAAWNFDPGALLLLVQ